MEVRDTIHGLVSYGEIEEQIINSVPFQRLRHIKQLALASSVYPGAHHTRFEHCIGTMCLAGKVADKLEMKGNDKTILRLAGLLHDIGHGPFSHVSEQILEKSSAKLIASEKVDGAHELLSILIIRRLNELASIKLSTEMSISIIDLLKKQDVRSVKKDIISGPLDVDKFDYLLRDSHFAGVRYGIFDLDKVVDSLICIDISSKEQQLGISEEGIYAVEQLLLARYHMNMQVYQHRIRRITDAMLVRGIEFALQERIKEIARLFAVEESDEFLRYYVQNNDETIMNAILTKSKGISGNYFKRIKERRLFKEVFSIAIDEHYFPDGIDLVRMKELSTSQIKNISAAAAKLFSQKGSRIDPELVIVDKKTIVNPTFRSAEKPIDSYTIMVKYKSGIRESFKDASQVFHNPSIDPKMDKLYVYLPLDQKKERCNRDTYISERKDDMISIIREAIR